MESDSTILDEDDSILQPTPTRISPTRYFGNPKDSVNDDCLSSEDTINKENININKCEGQKLNVEPMQMKKKRKGGGFNLRKSLAWDRAFFTEEGVLNPLELSMISGTDISSYTEGLSTINEDDSLSSDCQSNTESADLQVLEKNLFKEVPAISLKKNIVHLPPKHTPARVRGASTSLISTKVLPTRSATRAGSRGGSCTRPLLSSSSLKRPANVNASQAATKESKLPRIPVSRPGHSSTILKNKSATSNVKQKQITQPAFNIPNQRNISPKSSQKSVKQSQRKPKAGPGPLSVKASVSHSKRNVQVNSPICPNSITQLNSQARNKVTDSSPKLIPDRIGPSIAIPLPECLDGSSKLMASLPQDTSTTSSSKQQRQFLSMKPSGLRMPSPSLGFFGQPKASVSYCAPQKAVRNPGYSKPPPTPVRVSDVNYSIQTFGAVVLKSGSDSQAVSHERMKQNVGENAIKELNFSNEDKPSEPMYDTNAISSNLTSSVLGRIENRMSTCSDLENHDLLPQQNSTKSAKGVSRTRNTNGHSLSCLQDLHHVSEEHDDIFESSSDEPVRLASGNDHLLGGKDSHSKDSHNNSSDCLENTDFETPAFIKLEEKSSCSSFQKRWDDVSFQSHTEVPLELQSECFDDRTVVGKALENDSVQSLVESTSLVQKHKYSVTKNVGSDVICSSAITSSDSHSALIGNSVLDRQVNKEDRIVMDPERLVIVGTSMESQMADVNCGYGLAESILHCKEQNFNLQKIPETDPTVRDSSMILLEISNTRVKNARQIAEQAKEVISSSTPAQVEDEPVQNLVCDMPVESCIGHIQLVSDHFTAAVASETSRAAGLSNLCALVEKVPQFDQSFIPDSLLSRTIVAEVVRNTVYERGVHAVSETIGAGESIQVCGTPTQMHVNGDYRDIDNCTSNVLHMMPNCAEVEPSPESCRPLAGSQMKHDVEHDGLLVEDITSSGNRDQLPDVLNKKALPDERKADSPQDTSGTEEFHNDLDAGTCLVKDKDTISPINRSHSSSRTNARIILPTNAVPFSDEWLAAMEAAGEDILKMKSGAVQNSPTEKPMPEPSPWSPVRRKNNQIGPFDCTKFTNNLPSDSQ